jgi:hypothetical protein
MSSVKSYRHKVTGLIGQFPEGVALVDQNLVEVADDAKPLAYTPIDEDAIAALRDAALGDPNSETDEKANQS